MQNDQKLFTTKDYAKKNSPVVWAVLFNGIVMESNFISKEDAEHFRDNAYCGYYKNCEVKCIKNRKNK